ncbi:hypothetical protein [Wolbachia endosymbiont (group B) of Longitarsus flavicornis]|uniref:hypothetical protein n=1 Tax=Wolbachia endosymbiont (group B) of Longitarsus flavicornis TaxID=3066135 RepID=UPI0033410A3B
MVFFTRIYGNRNSLTYEEILQEKNVRERILTIHRHYEPSKLSDKCLSDAYGILLKRLMERKKKEFLNKKEIERNDNSSLICKSFIEETRAEQYNREPSCRA